MHSNLFDKVEHFILYAVFKPTDENPVDIYRLNIITRNNKKNNSKAFRFFEFHHFYCSKQVFLLYTELIK